jgi:hypothetical protein
MGRQTGGGNIQPSGVSIIIPKGGSGGTITVQDEGVTLSDEVTTLNFAGADVQATGSGSVITIYVPTPTFASHFNTTDGTTSGTVSESITRATARISTPTGEGTPFSTNGWAGTNQSASTNSTATFTTGGAVTGFGGDSTMTVTVYSADGSTVLETRTTPAITGDGSYGAGNITITISGYAADTSRFKATPSITVGIGAIFTAVGKEGGRYNVLISMTTDSANDGTGPYTYTQASVFYDTNPNTPSIGGGTVISETGGSVTTKHLSGIEYYTTGSAFTIAVTDIDNLNRNTAKTSGNLVLTAANYGIASLSQSPFGTGSGNFTGWTNAYNNQNANYSNAAPAISSSNFRYRGTGASASGSPRDTWANGSTVTSSTSAILVDTYATTSTNLVEDFDDENRRQTSNWNTGNTAGNWTSTNALSSGEALILGGKLMIPSTSTLTSGASQADFALYKPDAGGANPNYASLTADSSYYRTIVDTTGLNRSSFTMVFTGAFVANATSDLLNSHLEVFISRRASANGGFAGYNNTNLLQMHGANYNFASFDDGVTNGNIREASSSGGTVNCTFGGKTCETGFFMHIRITDSRVKIDRLSVTFY